VRALLAAMQLRATFRAHACEVRGCGKQGRTVKTSSRRYVLDEAREARACYVERGPGPLRFGAIAIAVSVVVAAFALLISALRILAVTVHTG
jgi:hypothetical protein